MSINSRIRKMKLVRRSTSSNEFNQKLENWDSVERTFGGSLTVVTSSKFSNMQALYEGTTHQIITRNVFDVDSIENRVLIGDDLWEITGAPVRTRRAMIIFVRSAS